MNAQDSRTSDQKLKSGELLQLDEESLSFYVANWRACAIVKNYEHEVARLDRNELILLRDWINGVLA